MKSLHRTKQVSLGGSNSKTTNNNHDRLSHPIGYFAGIDGLRALAVGLVVMYHLGISSLQGGYIGVDIFFVISGFLITSLLLNEKSKTGTIALYKFWGRRAKRLLPALFAMLAITSLAVWIFSTSIDTSSYRGDALSTVFYFANWHAIFSHFSYFAQFKLPSPLEHTWSLAIEEQFYLVWPLIILFTFWLGSFDQKRGIQFLKVFACIFSAGSISWLILNYHGAQSATSDYFSTFSRAFELLFGALIALYIRTPAAFGQVRHHILELIGTLSLVIVIFLAVVAGGPPAWMYYFGFVLCALSSTFILLNCIQVEPKFPFNIFSLPLLQYLGKISYGIYLWHWPIIVFANSNNLGIAGGTLTLVRVILILGLSTLSYHFLELPLRRYNYRSVLSKLLLPIAVLLVIAVIVVTTSFPSSYSASASQYLSSKSSNSANPINFVHKPVTWTPNTPLRYLQKPTESAPTRIMIVGDSVMWTAAPAVIAALDGTGQAQVFNAAIPGWGLTTATNWRSAVPKLIAQYHPSLVVGTWSWDNTLALEHPKAFESLVSQFISVVLSKGNGVKAITFFQFPALGPLWSIAPHAASQDATRQRGVVVWNRILTQLANKRPGRVAFLNVASSVENRGKFTAWLPGPDHKSIRARMVDNTHFCPWGAAIYAASIAQALHNLIGISLPKNSWWTQSWTADKRYNTSPPSCPNYHVNN